MDLNNIPIGFLVVGVLGLEQLLIFIFKYFNKAYNIKRGKEADNEMLHRHDSEIKELKNTVDKMFEMMTKSSEESKKTDCAILRNMIIDKFKICQEVYNEKGHISALDYENLNEMFLRYFASGGNHLISKIYESFKKFNVSLDESELISK